jgi:hypothetical protein
VSAARSPFAPTSLPRLGDAAEGDEVTTVEKTLVGDVWSAQETASKRWYKPEEPKRPLVPRPAPMPKAPAIANPEIEEIDEAVLLEEDEAPVSGLVPVEDVDEKKALAQLFEPPSARVVRATMTVVLFVAYVFVAPFAWLARIAAPYWERAARTAAARLKRGSVPH